MSTINKRREAVVDYLVKELGGQDVPAIGWASGIERLLLVINALHPMQTDSGLDLFLVVMGDEPRLTAPKLIQEWRNTGLKCDSDTLRRSIKAQMREANRQKARYVAILREEEFGQGIVQLKNYKTGDQEAVMFDQVVDAVKKNQ